jgi:hypothetical protein
MTTLILRRRLQSLSRERFTKLFSCIFLHMWNHMAVHVGSNADSAVL